MPIYILFILTNIFKTFIVKICEIDSDYDLLHCDMLQHINRKPQLSVLSYEVLVSFINTPIISRKSCQFLVAFMNMVVV